MTMATGPTGVPQDVLVLGGGIIGLCTTYSLITAGHRVTIVDRDRLGSGAARGNAGEVTPLNVLPLAGPNMLQETVRGILSRRHYLSIAPLALPTLATFGLSFLAHCTPRRLAAGTQALDQLVGGAFAAYDRYQLGGVSLSGGGTGYLYTHQDPAALAAFRTSLMHRSHHLGMVAPEPIITGSEMFETEPALSHSAQAAFIAPSERYLDPEILVDDLCARIRAARAQIIEHTEVIRVETDDSLPTAIVRTTRGDERLRASRIVIACGARTGKVLAASGQRVPARLRVQSGRGYSFTVGTSTLPSRLLGSLDQRTVAIPLSGRLRIVGLMDFDGSPGRFDPRRVQQLARRASTFLRDVDWDDVSDEWMGPRPMTPSGLPVISVLPKDPRILVATGHNMHGVSLGPVTGELVTALVEGRPGTVSGANIDMRPFALHTPTRGRGRTVKGLSQ